MILISFNTTNSISLLTTTSVPSLYDTITDLKTSLFSMRPSGSQYFSVYDTAFLSLIKDGSNRPIFSNSLKLLFSTVNKNGSWGNPSILSDTLLCTLASIYALQQSHLSSSSIVQQILFKSEEFVLANFNRISQDSFFTAGFEFLIPNLIQKTDLALIDHPITKKLLSYQHKKLSMIPLEYNEKKKTPMLFALESLDSFNITKNLDHFVEPNGSIATSPSTTTWYLNYNPKSDKISEMVRN